MKRKTNIKVSVIIPAYNEKANIRKVLASFLDQKNIKGKKIDFNLFEIIVVDNNSTDNTPHIVEQFHKKYPQLNIHLIKEINKQGIIPARLRGFDYSLGKNSNLKKLILASTDADVIVNPNWIDGIIKTFKKTRADFLVGDSYFGKTFWNKVPNLSAWIRNIKKDLLQVENDFIFMLGGNNFAMTNKIYLKIRKELYNSYDTEKSSGDRVFGSNAKLVGTKFASLPYVNTLSPRRFVYVAEDLFKKGTYGAPECDIRKSNKDINQQMKKIDRMAKEGYFDTNKFIKSFLRDYLFTVLTLDHSLLKTNKKYFVGFEKDLKNDLTKLNNKNYWNNLDIVVKQATLLSNKYWRKVYKNIKSFQSHASKI